MRLPTPHLPQDGAPHPAITALSTRYRPRQRPPAQRLSRQRFSALAKGRRTEIEFLNGFVVREGEHVGIQARANERLVDIVKKVERGELKQDPRHITELRLN